MAKRSVRCRRSNAEIDRAALVVRVFGLTSSESTEVPATSDLSPVQTGIVTDALNLPTPCLVILAGPGASGKSTWAAAHFPADVIVLQ